MSEGAGPVPSPSQWARVQLAQGHSEAGLWDLSSDVPEARITIGSSPTAGWLVSAPEVAPVHFELFWDGSSLWLSPPHEGELTVDGERVGAWRQLVGRCRLEFGRAAFLVETSQTIAVPVAPATNEANSLTATPSLDTSLSLATTPGALVGGRPPSASSFDDDPTAALMSRPDLSAPLEPDATRMLEGAFDHGAAHPPAPSASAFGRPKLGALAAPPSAGGMGGEMKTQILDTEAAGIHLRRSSVPPVPPSGSGPSFTAPGPALGRERQIATDVLQAPQGKSVTDTGSQFALPPVHGAKEKKKIELPPRRTLILAGVTLLIAVFVLGSSVLRRQALDAERARAVASSATQDATATAEAARAQAAAQAEARSAARDTREVALREEVAPAIEEASEEARSASASAAESAADSEETFDAEADVLERQRLAVQKLAVDALTRNDKRVAFGFYLWLAETYPDQTVYQGVVQVLREATRPEANR